MKTKTKLKKIFEGKPNFHEQSIVSGFTNRRAICIEDLTEQEAENLYLIYCPKKVENPVLKIAQEIELKKWKSNCIAKAQHLGITHPNNWDAFNLWMVTYSIYKKHLNAHNLQELKELHRQLCAVELSDYRSGKKPMTEAWLKRGNELKNLN